MSFLKFKSLLFFLFFSSFSQAQSFSQNLQLPFYLNDEKNKVEQNSNLNCHFINNTIELCSFDFYYFNELANAKIEFIDQKISRINLHFERINNSIEFNTKLSSLINFFSSKQINYFFNQNYYEGNLFSHTQHNEQLELLLCKCDHRFILILY